MKLQSAVLTMAMAFGIVSGACSARSGTPSGTGGSSSGGGTGGSSGGGGASCSNVAPCGGNVVGTWTVTSSCLKVTGNLDVAGFGLGCSSVPVTGSLQVTGTWTANSDGTYSDNTTTSGTEQLTLPASCLMVSGTTTTCDGITGPLRARGFASLNCTDAASGGCTCSATVQQTGGLGLVSVAPSTSGNYTTSGNVVTISGDSGDAHYSYCVSGNQMTWTPQSTSPTMMGTVVLQNGGTIGTGGATGSGGRSGTGGSSTGTGGSSTGTGGRGGTTGTGGGTGTGGAGGSTASASGPCDIYAAASPATPCVAAYSTVRRLASTYTGPLYQVRKAGTMTTDGTGSNMKTGIRLGGTIQDIAQTDGFADSAAQDAFCGTDSCTVSILYDQSGRGNHLRVAPAGCYVDGSSDLPDFESNANGRSLMVGGHRVYALYTNTREGYRNNAPTGMPMDTAPQGIYMVADGRRSGTACCWDFGNASKDNCYGTTGMMGALFLGTGFWGRGAGAAPWFMADFEAGVWAGGSGASNVTNPNLPSSNVDYAIGLLKTTSTNYVIRVGNAQSGALTTATDSASPKTTLRLNGAIILGIGGDNSNHSFGTFFEGVITAGQPSDVTDTAVLQNVQAAGYGR